MRVDCLFCEIKALRDILCNLKSRLGKGSRNPWTPASPEASGSQLAKWDFCVLRFRDFPHVDPLNSSFLEKYGVLDGAYEQAQAATGR